MVPIFFPHQKNRRLLTKVLFSSNVYKMYSFRQLVEQRIENDPIFREKAANIKRMFALNKITREQQERLYFQALDESIKRAKTS